MLVYKALLDSPDYSDIQGNTHIVVIAYRCECFFLVRSIVDSGPRSNCSLSSSICNPSHLILFLRRQLHGYTASKICDAKRTQRTTQRTPHMTRKPLPADVYSQIGNTVVPKRRHKDAIREAEAEQEERRTKRKSRHFHIH